jgi:hypothetical protein
MRSTLRWFPMPAAAALFTLTACANRAQRPAAEAPAAAPALPASAPAQPRTAPDWLTVDSANQTAILTLEVTARPNAPSALINGHRAGEARIIVPLGWTVTWNWRNADTTSHSLVVMVQREKLPLEGGRPAFTNAMTRMVTEGLPPGGTDKTTFVAEEAGWYWLMCGVPGHALASEWLELRVDPGASMASVEIKKA